MNKWHIMVLLFLAALLVFMGVGAEDQDSIILSVKGFEGNPTEVSGQYYYVVTVTLPQGAEGVFQDGWLVGNDTSGDTPYEWNDRTVDYYGGEGNSFTICCRPPEPFKDKYFIRLKDNSDSTQSLLFEYTSTFPNADRRLSLGYEDYEPSKRIEKTEDGITVPLYYFFDFTIHAEREGLEEIRFVCGDDSDFVDLDDRGNCWYGWGPMNEDNNGTHTYTAYVYAKYQNEEDWVFSNPVLVHVTMKERVQNDVIYTVSEGQQSEQAEGQTVYLVPRDGRFEIDVNNIGADFYGMYIGTDDNWIADSHWVWRSDLEQGTTRVPLTVPRCEAGKNYDVHVFAVKWGAPFKVAENTIPIKVTDVSGENKDPDVIVSMKDEYVAGEPLRVFAHYENPDHINGWMQIRIHEKNDPDSVIYDEGGPFEDYWDDGAVFWYSGEYVVDALIWEDGENDEPYDVFRGVKAFSVKANEEKTVAVPQTTTFQTYSAGQGLELTVKAEASEEEIVPEILCADLIRVDWDWQPIDEQSKDPEEGVAAFTFAEDKFEIGGFYEIRLTALAYGYTPSEFSFRFVVVSDDLEEQSLTLTVNGSAEKEMAVLSSQNVYVKVAYEEERPTVIRVLRDGWEQWWGDDSFDRNWGFGDDDLIMYAEASWDNIDFDELERKNWQIIDDENEETGWRIVNNLDEEGWREFDWNQDVNWTAYSNTILLHITSPNGEMKVPAFEVLNEGFDDSETIPWGDDLIVKVEDATPTDARGNAVPDGWFFGNLYVQENEDGDTWWERIDNDYQIQCGENYIPTFNLDENRHYRFEVGADAEGYSGRSCDFEFTTGVKPEGTEYPIKSFTVNGEIGSVEVQTSVELNLSAYHSDAEWYTVDITRENDEGWYDHCDRGNGMLYDSWRASEAGTYILTAYAKRENEYSGFDYDPEAEEWRAVIGTITVTANASGDLDEVVAYLTTETGKPDKAYLGETLTLTFEKLENAVTYSYWIHNEWDDEWLTGGERTGEGVLTIETWKLESGVYWVELDANAPGYNQSHASLQFALLDRDSDVEYSDSEGTCYITTSRIDASGVPTETPIHVIAYLPEAERIRLYLQKTVGENVGELEEEGELEGSGISDWFRIRTAGIYKLYTSGLYGGIWSEPKYACTMIITAGRTLNTPEITINGYDDGTIVKADNSDTHKLTIQISNMDEKTEYYQVAVRAYGDDWWFINDEYSPDEIGDLEINHGEIEPGRMYEVYCAARATGYNFSEASRQVLLLEEVPEEVTLSLESENGMEDIPDWPSSKNLQFRLYALDAQAVRFLRFDGNWEYRDGCAQQGGWFDWSDGPGRGEYTVLAQAAYNGNGDGDGHDFLGMNEEDWENFNWDGFDWEGVGFKWTAVSNPIKVSVVSNGRLNPADYTIEKTRVTRGENLIVKINTLQNKNEWYGARFVGDDWESEYYSWNESQKTIVVPTADFDAGEYRLLIWTDAEGIEGIETFADITIEDPQVSGIVFSVSETEVLLGQPVTCSIYARGAERVGFSVDGDRWDLDEEGKYCWGDYPNWTDSENVRWDEGRDVGEHTLVAYAQYKGSNEWVPSEEIVVTVKSLGRLEFDFSDLPAYVTTGELVDFVFKLPENAEAMHIGVYVDWDDDEGWHRNVISLDREYREDTTITIPSDALTAGHRLVVDYGAWATGYEGTGDSLNLPIVNPAGKGATLKLMEGAIVDQENGIILVDGGVKFLITPDEGEKLAAVRFYDGNGFWEWGEWITPENHGDWFEEDGSAFFWCSYHDLRNYAVYAEVQLESGEEFTTNVLTISLQVYGDVGSFDFANLETVTVPRGEMVTFTFTEAEYANRYWVDAFKDENGYDPRSSYEGTTVTMSTAGLEPGEYEVWGRAGGKEGWRWTESEHPLRLVVTLPEIPPSGILLTFSKEEVETMEEFMVSVLAPGAEQVRLAHMELENIWWEENGDNGSGNHWLSRGEGKQTFYAYAKFGDEWRGPVAKTITLKQAALGDVNFTTPVALTRIEDRAFEEIGAKTVRLSDKVASIGERAFADSAVRKIYIPAGIKKENISDSAFDGCKTLIIFCAKNSGAEQWVTEREEWMPVTFINMD